VGEGTPPPGGLRARALSGSQAEGLHGSSAGPELQAFAPRRDRLNHLLTACPLRGQDAVLHLRSKGKDGIGDID
jgi:hypothetical protein